MNVDGRRVLLTGAAGGIGRAIALALHRRGAVLVLSGRNAEGLEALRSRLGERAEVVLADLSEETGVPNLVEGAGAIDVLVANAALPGSGRFLDLEPEQIDRALDVNLRAPMALTRALAPGMVERGTGHLVFISSLNGKVATGGSSVYAATKFGMRGFAFGLREDLRASGVGVTTVFPGFISDAGMWADGGLSLPPGVGTRTPEQVAEAVVRGIETGRAEIDVAPLPLRVGGWVAGVAPTAIAAFNRRMGSERLSDALADAQRDKR